MGLKTLKNLILRIIFIIILTYLKNYMKNQKAKEEFCEG
jgi:hypothetical protein